MRGGVVWFLDRESIVEDKGRDGPRVMVGADGGGREDGGVR